MRNVQPEWITVSEASKIYSLSKPTIRKLIERGDVIAIKPAKRKLLINKKSFDDYMMSEYKMLKLVEL